MKKTAKKLISLIFILALTATLLITGVSAAKVGSVIGYAEPRYHCYHQRIPD